VNKALVAGGSGFLGAWVASVDEVIAEIRRQVHGARLQAEGAPLTMAAGLDGARPGLSERRAGAQPDA
jgi:hypothetical protein